MVAFSSHRHLLFMAISNTVCVGEVTLRLFLRWRTLCCWVLVMSQNFQIWIHLQTFVQNLSFPKGAPLLISGTSLDVQMVQNSRRNHCLCTVFAAGFLPLLPSPPSLHDSRTGWKEKVCVLETFFPEAHQTFTPSNSSATSSLSSMVRTKDWLFLIISALSRRA